MIAALYVETGGCYFGLPDVDPWDQARDAREYAGPWPVVGHPPCQRWGKMWFGSPNVVKLTGHRKSKGEDGGCFAAALASVRKWGQVDTPRPSRPRSFGGFPMNSADTPAHSERALGLTKHIGESGYSLRDRRAHV